jgi:putative transposase
VTVYLDVVGDWWCAFVTSREAELLPALHLAIGIDWGMPEIATPTPDTHGYVHPARRRSAQARLAYYQRMMARRRLTPSKQASLRYRKAKREVTKVRRQVSRRCKGGEAKWATW